MAHKTVFRSRKLYSFSARILTLLVLLVGMLPASSAAAQAANLALNKPVTCSSTQFPCAEAVDGNPGTRWSSAHGVDPQWIYVDLGQNYNITQVVLRWEAAYATAFQIQTSTNASTWTTIYSTATGTGGTQTLNVTGSGCMAQFAPRSGVTRCGNSKSTVRVDPHSLPRERILLRGRTHLRVTRIGR